VIRVRRLLRCGNVTGFCGRSVDPDIASRDRLSLVLTTPRSLRQKTIPSPLRPMPVFKRTANREKLLLGFSYERSPLQAANTSPLILYSPKVDIAQKTLGLFWTPSRFKAK
jgi:hypothetical protein